MSTVPTRKITLPVSEFTVDVNEYFTGPQTLKMQDFEKESDSLLYAITSMTVGITDKEGKEVNIEEFLNTCHGADMVRLQKYATELLTDLKAKARGDK